MSPSLNSPGKAELEILEVLWKFGPSTARVISDALAEAGSPRADTTVHTMLLRLKQKKLVSSRKTKSGMVFQARLDKQQFAERSVHDLLDKLGQVTAIPVVKALIERQSLTTEEVQELRGLVEQLSYGDEPKVNSRQGPKQAKRAKKATKKRSSS